MRRNVCTFAGLVLFTLMMAGRAEAQHDCGEYCRWDSPCNYFCDYFGQPATCLVISSCTFECWSTCNSPNATCDTFCWDGATPTTCGEQPYGCGSALASNTETEAAANAEQCVASRGAPAGEAAGQTRADVNRRRSDDVGELSGPLGAQDIQ